MDIVLSFIQFLLAALLIVLVLMHSGKDTGLSGMFNPGQSQFGGTAAMERNLTRLTIVVSGLVAVNGVTLVFGLYTASGAALRYAVLAACAGGGIGRRA